MEQKQGKRTDLTSRQNGEKLTTAERLANEYGVSSRTIERDGKYAEAIDTIHKNVGGDTRRNILSGKLKVAKQDA